MIVSRRKFMHSAGCGLAGMSATLPRFAHGLAPAWANCSKGTQTQPFKQVSADVKVAYFDDWRLGDCELFGANLTLNHSKGTGTFTGNVCTHFTHSKDIWHFYVELAEVAVSSTYLTIFQWDGPKMSEQDKPLFHSWTENFRYSESTRVKFARATSCC